MQGSKVQLILAVCLAAGVGLRTSAQNLSLRADIPFEFNVGNTRMPAGVCAIETTTTSGVLKIRSDHGDQGIFLPGAARTNTRGSEKSWLVFRQYGDQYFLAEIRTGWNGVEYGFGISRVEKEKAVAVKHPTTRLILAQR
jgi:hypothetical protein